MEGQERNLRKVRMGEVVSTKMEKTIVVRVDEVKKHPIYKKAVHYSKKFKDMFIILKKLFFVN